MEKELKSYAEAWVENNKDCRMYKLIYMAIAFLFFVIMIIAFVIAFNL